MSSPISSALEKLDGSLLALQSEVGCLKAGLEVSDDQLRQRLAEARQHATAVRDLIHAERADAQWGDRQALDQLILDLESAAREKVNEERRTRLLELAGEFEAGSIKHRFESRVSALNALRDEAVAQLRADAALKEQEKVLPGPDAGEWLHWACNLQEDSDAATLDQLQRDFPAVAGFTGEMEESYWVAGTRAAVIPTSAPQAIVPPARESAPPAPAKPPAQTAPAPPTMQPPAIEKVAAAAQQAKPSEPIILPGRQPAQEPVLPVSSKVAAAAPTLPVSSKAAVATVAVPQEKPAPPMAAPVTQPAPKAKAAEAPAKETRPAVEPVRPSAPNKQWAAAAATAPAKEPEKKVVAAATVAAATAAVPAAASAPRMKYCDKCGSTYPAQFNVCPIDSAPLRFTNEPAVATARDSSAVVDKKGEGAVLGAAVATATQVSPKSRSGGKPAEASHEAAKADFSEIRATLREHSEQEAMAEEHRGAEWQALLRDKNWHALAANPMVLAAATLVLVLLVGGILWRAHRSHVSNDSVRAMEKAPDQPASNPQPELSTPAAAAATPTTVNPSAGTPSQGKPTEQNAAKQPSQNAQQQKPASDTQNQPKPTQVLSLPMPGTRDVATARNPEAPNDTIEPPSSIPGALPNTSPNNLGAIAKDVPVAVPTLNQQKLRVSSGIAQAQLTHKVNPQYPPEAFQSRVHGTVVLQAQIGKDGAVKGVKVVSGPPMLIKAATEAVKQWRYKPFTLNGEPVEADTQINVNFSLE